MKIPRRRYIPLIYFLFLFILATNTANSAQSDRYFDIGVKAAQRQQYQVALKAFLQAKSAGLNSPELDYNLGVVYYKLARFRDAGKQFRRLARDKGYSAVAFYNLGLVYLKLDNEDAAKNWFVKAYTNADDEKLKNLSRLALQRLHVDVPPKSSVAKGWNGFISAGLGYDNNVSLVDEELGLSQSISDFYTELLAVANRMVWGEAEKGVRFSASVDVLDQQTQQDYDYSQWHVGLTRLDDFGHWETRAGAGIDRTRFSGADFQQLVSVEFRALRPLSLQTDLGLWYKYVDIQDQSPAGIYSYLEGGRHLLRLRLTDTVKTVRLRYIYEIQVNDRADYSSRLSRTVGNTTQVSTISRSYSPLRNSFHVVADMPLNKALTLKLDGQYRYSYYNNADTEQIVEVDATGNTTTLSSTTLQREDHRYKAGIGVEYLLAGDLELYSHYSYTKNDSNRPGSDYRRSLISAGLNWYY